MWITSLLVQIQNICWWLSNFLNICVTIGIHREVNRGACPPLALKRLFWASFQGLIAVIVVQGYSQSLYFPGKLKKFCPPRWTKFLRTPMCVTLLFRHFADINNKATEEVWYRRAVDYYKINPKSFVYSIPFDVGAKKTRVLATHAIMVGKGNEKAPAAVAGVQIDYDIFREMFFNETTKVSKTWLIIAQDQYFFSSTKNMSAASTTFLVPRICGGQDLLKVWWASRAMHVTLHGNNKTNQPTYITMLLQRLPQSTNGIGDTSFTLRTITFNKTIICLKWYKVLTELCLYMLTLQSF